MWIDQHEAVEMYARFFKKRHGRSASKRVREKAEELKRKGDLRGHEIWNDVAREMEQLADTSAAARVNHRYRSRPAPKRATRRQNGITGSWNPANHMLSLTGTAAVADYEAALRSVTFDNLTNDNPAASTTRVLIWFADDGDPSTQSNQVTTEIKITGVNDAPTAQSGTSVGAADHVITAGA